MINVTILLAAIAIVESGSAKHPDGDDCAIGRRGEVSRYQIMPRVWKKYAHASWRPDNPTHAEAVAGMYIVDIRARLGPTRRDSVYLIARTWNGGPKPKRATISYGMRVTTVYESIASHQKP